MIPVDVLTSYGVGGDGSFWTHDVDPQVTAPVREASDSRCRHADQGPRRSGDLAFGFDARGQQEKPLVTDE